MLRHLLHESVTEPTLAEPLAVHPAVTVVAAVLVGAGCLHLAGRALARRRVLAGPGRRWRARRSWLGSGRRRRTGAAGTVWAGLALALPVLAALLPARAAGAVGAAGDPVAAAGDVDDPSVGTAGTPTPGVAVMRAEADAGGATSWLPRSAAPGPTGPEVLPADVAVSAATPVASPQAATSPPAPAPADGPSTPAARRTHVVRPGEHLWGIAEEDLAARLGRAPTEAEVAPAWQALIAANRDRLLDPSNPDLIVPGQHLVLPA